MPEVKKIPVGVVATPLPPFVDRNELSSEQLRTLLSIADAILPGIVPSTASKVGPNQIALPAAEYERSFAALKQSVPSLDNALVQQMLAESPSSIPGFQDLILRAFNVYASQSTITAMKQLLTGLNYGFSCWFLTGHYAPFHELPVATRTQAIKNWGKSPIALIRMAGKQLATITKNFYIKTSPTLFPAILHPPYYTPQELGKSYPFRFEEVPKGPESQEFIFETDVVIVGSGCGGGVVAKNLAADGHRVIVLEKSLHYRPENLPMTDLAGSVHMYEGGQVLPSEDGSIAGVFAGSAWGGGGAVNWSACLQTQGYVRREWAAQGLPFFDSPEFQESLDRVEDSMGAQSEITEQNRGNQMLLDGGRRLGYSAKKVKQNTNNKRHYCGYCGGGCRSTEKMGPHNYWLPQAAETGNARFIQGCEVQHVIFDKANKKKAVGVKAIWTKFNERYETEYKRTVIIRAKKVIISSGSLCSPIVLMNSGINGYNVGRNLHLHPTTHVFGIFDKEVNPCEGGILTSVVTDFERVDGNWGPKLEAASMLPSNTLSLVPWNSPLQWKTMALKHKHMAGYIVLTRDRYPGRVLRDPVSGRPKIHYTVSDFDKATALEGIIGMARILFEQGAAEIHTVTGGAEPYIRNRKRSSGELLKGDFKPNDNVDEATLAREVKEFGEWQAHIRNLGLPYPAATFASAHQMGTCRMGTTPVTGVVDPNCKVWDRESLYVMDASVFPSASGVNPMVTNLAIADAMSRRLSKLMLAEKR
jgi:choline dehydrogenase-like flavoprotein